MAELERPKEELLTELAATRRELAQAQREIAILKSSCAAPEAQWRANLDRVKAEFINAASHELRTPLSLIMAYSEFLEDNLAGALTEPQQDYLSQIQQGARRLQRIVDDLLEYASLQTSEGALDCQQTDMAEVVRSQVEALQPVSAAAGVLLTLALEKSPCLVSVDPNRLGLVVYHLVENAIKFTRPGGRVVVRLALEGQAVKVEVADTGIGISQEHLENLFHTAFYQVEPSLTRTHGGAGLGLSLCRAIVLAHGGTIGAQSEEGRGSTFWFTVPRRGADVR